MPVAAAGVGWAAAVAAMGALVTVFSGNLNYAPGACTRLETYLPSKIVGQELALRQATDAICDHLARDGGEGGRPLVLSVHGPPGVGKSMFHHMAARALYSRRLHEGLRCPGYDCAGYKVLYGMDYTADERAAQEALLRASILHHLKHAPESLLVIEEYDKLDCPTRGFFRQLLENSQVANVSLGRAVVVLESNLGYTQLHRLLEAAGGARGAVSAEDAQRALKDLVFNRWLAEGCEERTDTLKMVGLIDFFLPFLPLERRHVAALFGLHLGERAREELEGQGLGSLAWDAGVIDFLTDKVDFEGEYPIEGAKEVGTLVTRYASRPLREWAAAQHARREAARAAQWAAAGPLLGGLHLPWGRGGGGDSSAPQQQQQQPPPPQEQEQQRRHQWWQHRPPPPLPGGRLRVAADGRSLVIEAEAAAAAAAAE